MHINSLLEGISQVVYHYTSLPNFHSMLENNEIRLSPGAFTKDVEFEKGMPGYFLSTSRTRTGKFNLERSSGVLIKLDGRKLANRMKGKALDYFSPSMRKFDPTNFEQEDRIFSHTPEIKNILHYILAVDILVPHHKATNNQEQLNKYAYLSYSYLRKNNIPVRVYADDRAWVTGSPKTLAPEDIRGLYNKSKLTGNDPSRSQAFDSVVKDMRFVLKALKFDDFSKFDKEEQQMLKSFLNYYDFEKNNPGGLISSFQNATSKSNTRKLLNEIYKAMKGYGIKDITPMKIAKTIRIKWNHILGRS